MKKIRNRKISCSIVIYNTDLVQLERLLFCVYKTAVVDQIYLVDNSPIPSDSPLYHLPKITYIKTEKNLGYGAAHNIGLRDALIQSEFHFVLNPDIYFEPDSFQAMIDRMQQDESIGQLMPKVIYPDGRLQYLCKLIPNPMDLFFRRFLRVLLKALMRQRAEDFELRFTGYSKEMDVPILSGCFMLFRTDALRKVGLFDERYFMYLEDFDLTRRMHAQFRTLFFPDAIVVHDHAKESYGFNKMLFVHVVSAVKYFNKWGWIFDAPRKATNARVLAVLKSLS